MFVLRINPAVPVLSGLILKKEYEIFVGTNETFRKIRVSVERGSTLTKKSSIFRMTEKWVPLSRPTTDHPAG